MRDVAIQIPKQPKVRVEKIFVDIITKPFLSFPRVETGKKDLLIKLFLIVFSWSQNKSQLKCDQ